MTRSMLAMCILCGGAERLSAADFHIEGSSTVYPITVAITGKWAEAGHARISVSQNGSGAGIKQLIAGTVPIADSSRAMTRVEVEAAAAHGVDVIEVPIAMDGITVVVNVDNTFLSAITTEQLKSIWAPTSTLTSWAQVHAGWPDQPLALCRPGNNSGTLEYFTTVIVGKAGAIRQDAFANEDFSVLTQQVIANRYALSFCGWAYARSNVGMLRQVPIDNGTGPQEATRESIISGAYPLSRPLFIYLDKNALRQPEVADFVTFYLSQVAKVTEEVGYVPLPDAIYERIRERVAKRVVGCPFAIAPKGTSVEHALNGDFTQPSLVVVRDVSAPPAAPPAATSATSATAATPAMTTASSPQTSRNSAMEHLPVHADAERRRALSRVRDASLSLARTSLDPASTADELEHCVHEAQSAIDALRDSSQPGIASAGSLSGPGPSDAISREGYTMMVDRLHLRAGADSAISDDELEAFKRDLRAVHDDALRQQLAVTLGHVSRENLPNFVDSVSKLDGGKGWRPIDVLRCYALGDWAQP